MATNFKVDENYLPPFVKMDEILTDGNVRPMDEKHVKELAASIKKSTLLERPTVQKVGEGQYKIVSGFHRIAAMKLLKWENVPVQLAGERVGQHARVTANIMKLDMPAMEIAREFTTRCTEDDQISAEKVKELAGELGRSESFVRNYIKLKTDLVGEIQDLLANPKSNFTLAHGLAAATTEKAKQAEVFALWKYQPGVAADTVKVWAKNPQKAAEAIGMKPKEAGVGKVTTTGKESGEKPYHAGTEYQKNVARLVKAGFDAELVNDSAKGIMPLMEMICNKVVADGMDFDALMQKLTEALA